MKKNMFFSGLVAAAVSLVVLGVFVLLNPNDKKTLRIEHVNAVKGQSTLYSMGDSGEIVPLDFTQVAEDVVSAVVHIKATQTTPGIGDAQAQNVQPRLPEPFRDFFESPFFRFEQPGQGDVPQVRMGTGSGVIIESNGYIVTNNHVIANADDLEVTLQDNRTFKATVLGTDPTTDLALIQIDGNDLPTIPMTTSEDVKVGQWVLAVGNPMGLNSTVTAGIVSAKGRNINILRDRFAVESFIQTDAAINPGNSGGALVDLNGGLVGINTAIASPTGSYAGYGFAIPSDIVKKVVEDLAAYGMVQRGILGVMIRSLDGNLAAEKGIDIVRGVYVDSLLENSAAAVAGVKVGDVITAVNGQEVSGSPQLQGKIAQFRPGDKVELAINRAGRTKVIEVVLNDRNGQKRIVKREHRDLIAQLGAELETLDTELADKLGIEGGVKVTRLYAGKLKRSTAMREGFIITGVDGEKVKTIDQFARVLENKRGGVLLEGVYENQKGVHYYAFGMEG
jgi:serine protease Do